MTIGNPILITVINLHAQTNGNPSEHNTTEFLYLWKAKELFE